MRQSTRMIAGFFVLVAAMHVKTTFGQKSLELVLLGRYDKHAGYVSNFAGRAYDDYHKLYGTSYGINVNYRQAISRRISAYLGVGYYQLNIDKIRGPIRSNVPGTRTARNINYDDGMTNLLYSTSEYRYNNLALTAGAGYLFPLQNASAIEAGAELINYLGFSQRYRLFDKDYWRTRQRKAPEFGFNVSVGLYKQYNDFYFRPALIIPIFQNLKGDAAFYEDRNMNIPKWFSGIGLRLVIGKQIAG